MDEANAAVMGLTPGAVPDLDRPGREIQLGLERAVTAGLSPRGGRRDGASPPCTGGLTLTGSRYDPEKHRGLAAPLYRGPPLHSLLRPERFRAVPGSCGLRWSTGRRSCDTARHNKGRSMMLRPLVTSCIVMEVLKKAPSGKTGRGRLGERGAGSKGAPQNLPPLEVACLRRGGAPRAGAGARRRMQAVPKLS